jgi:ferredoxin
MPKLTIKGVTTDVEQGKRLVLAIEDTGVNIGHRCGGIAKCTTCRVTFASGEPDKMTAAELEVLEVEGLVGEVRLSCQMTCEQDMDVEPVFLVENEPDWDDAGAPPETSITPDPEWIDKP